MLNNNAKQVKDAEELYRYRLSMDPQLTVPGDRVIQFMAKYQDFYQRLREKKEQWQTLKT